MRRVLWRRGVLSYGLMNHDVGDQDVTYGVYVTGNRANVSQCYELRVDVDVFLLLSLLELRYAALNLLDIYTRARLRNDYTPGWAWCYFINETWLKWLGELTRHVYITITIRPELTDLFTILLQDRRPSTHHSWRRTMSTHHQQLALTSRGLPNILYSCLKTNNVEKVKH